MSVLNMLRPGDRIEFVRGGDATTVTIIQRIEEERLVSVVGEPVVEFAPGFLVREYDGTESFLSAQAIGQAAERRELRLVMGEEKL